LQDNFNNKVIKSRKNNHDTYKFGRTKRMPSSLLIELPLAGDAEWQFKMLHPSQGSTDANAGAPQG